MLEMFPRLKFLSEHNLNVEDYSLFFFYPNHPCWLNFQLKFLFIAKKVNKEN